MTWNIFLGGDVSRLLSSPTAAELGEAAVELFAEVEANDFHDRAAAIADAVVAQQPDLIGLQEVALWRTQVPADGSTTPATDTALDFATILLAALEERGADYTIAVIAEEVDGEVSTPARDIRFTDRDVVLARSDNTTRLTVTDSSTGRFETNFTTDSPLGEITVERGWAAVEISLEGRNARFVTTHLEVAPFEGIQLPQAEQLVAEAMAANVPTILAGDINSPADGSGTATYDHLIDSGFDDAWTIAHGEEPGYTCCHGSDLAADDRVPDSRIDVALLLGDFDVVDAEVIGVRAEERSAAGRWPSDHAGVVVTLRFP